MNLTDQVTNLKTEVDLIAKIVETDSELFRSIGERLDALEDTITELLKCIRGQVSWEIVEKGWRTRA